MTFHAKKTHKGYKTHTLYESHNDLFNVRTADQNICNYICWNDEFSNAHVARSHIIFVKGNNQLVLIVDIEILIFSYIFKLIKRSSLGSSVEIQ